MKGSNEEKAGLARSAGKLRRLLSLLVAFLAFVLAAERFGYAWHAADAGGLGRAIFDQSLLSIPGLFYLAALWQLRGAAASVASGAAFDRAVARGIRRLGLLLAIGASASLL